MKIPQLPENEVARVAALRRYGILDTSPEAAFDELAELAAALCGTPVAAQIGEEGRSVWPVRIGGAALEPGVAGGLVGARPERAPARGVADPRTGRAPASAAVEQEVAVLRPHHGRPFDGDVPAARSLAQQPHRLRPGRPALAVGAELARPQGCRLPDGVVVALPQ